MRKLLAKFILTATIITLFATSAFAANLFGPPGLDTTYGVQVRLRDEFQKNNYDLNTGLSSPASSRPDQDFFRLRTLAFLSFNYEKKYDFMIRFANEMRYYHELFASYRSADHFYTPDELLIDNLYVSAYDLFGFPLDLRIGRQDMMIGDGFLIADGTPGDGSRTLFFNAAKGTVKFSKDHNLDLIYISNARTDETLTFLYDSIYGKKALNTSDEQAFVVYLHSKINANVLLEPYFIYKREDSFSKAIGSGRVQGLDLNTYGGRAVLTYAPFTLKGEMAWQKGGYDDNGVERSGFGAHVEVQANLEKVFLKPQLEIGFVTLSGDDSTTGKKVEAWDPLFSRYPMWSDLFVFTLLTETGNYGNTPGYWTNLQIYRANAKLNFTTATYFLVGYNYLRANEYSSGNGSAMFTNNSKDRGHLFTGKLNHIFNKYFEGFVAAEYFLPGDFYGPAADNAIFFRAQLNFKF